MLKKYISSDIITEAGCTAVLPICFLLAVFYETLFNQAMIALGFVFFCVVLFSASWRFETGLFDKFIIAAVAASFITTLRAADIFADAGAAYTHIEELQRIISAFMIASVLYHRQRRAFDRSMTIISWEIWLTMIYELVRHAQQLLQAEGIVSFSTFEKFLIHLRNLKLYATISFYRHPIPAMTVLLVGWAIPMVRGNKRVDFALKAFYIPLVILIYSRSAWLGAAALLGLVLLEGRREKGKSIGSFWIVIVAAMIAALGAIYYLMVVRGVRTSMERIRYWVYLLTTMFPERPLISKIFGNGFYTSVVMDQTPVANPGFPAVDNAFLTILYENGMVGFTAVVGLLIRALKSAWEVREERCYANALLAASVTAVFYEIHFWDQAGFLVAVLAAVFFGGRKSEVRK